MEPKETTDIAEAAEQNEAIDQADGQDSEEITTASDGSEADAVLTAADAGMSDDHVQEDADFDDLASLAGEDDASDESSATDAGVGRAGTVFPLAEDLRLEAKIEAIIFASPKPMRATEIYEILLAQERDTQQSEGQAGVSQEFEPEKVDLAESEPGEDEFRENEIDENDVGENEFPVESDRRPPSDVDSLQQGLTLRHVQVALDNLTDHFRDRCGGFHLAYIKRMGYQFQTVPAAAALMEKQFAKRPRPISRAALETLSIIAYRQPCTRAEVEFVRGVDAGSIINTLMERGMIACVGRKEIPGRPMLFGTTDEFLKTFQLGHVKDLPSLESFQPATDVLKSAFEKLAAGPEATDVEEFIGDEEYGVDGEAALEEAFVEGGSGESPLDAKVAEAARELMEEAPSGEEALPRLAGASAFDDLAIDLEEMDTNDGTDSTAALDFPAGLGDTESGGELDS